MNLQAEDLGPLWDLRPEELEPGWPRFWLRSGLAGIAYNPEDGTWIALDADGNLVSEDLAAAEDARRVAEQLAAEDEDELDPGEFGAEEEGRGETR